MLHVNTLPVLALRYLLEPQLLQHYLLEQVVHVYLLLRLVFFGVHLYDHGGLGGRVARVRRFALLEGRCLARSLIPRGYVAILDTMRLREHLFLVKNKALVRTRLLVAHFGLPASANILLRFFRFARRLTARWLLERLVAHYNKF